MDASRAERLIHEILVDYGVNFKMEYIFPDLKSENGKPLRFDFVIFDVQSLAVSVAYTNSNIMRIRNEDFAHCTV